MPSGPIQQFPSKAGELESSACLLQTGPHQMHTVGNIVPFKCFRRLDQEKLPFLESATGKASGIQPPHKAMRRCLPSPSAAQHPLYHLQIFAPHDTVAKSHFWYFVSQLKKMKSLGAIVHCGQMFEESPVWVKNFSIWQH
ncbi:hypothetical protein MC885_017773 [Smutsia gigantea]|nr:hypothetical protein MC885_017773 [Smutsia gigantea]